MTVHEAARRGQVTDLDLEVTVHVMETTDLAIELDPVEARVMIEAIRG